MANKTTSRTVFDWKRNYLTVLSLLMAVVFITVGFGFALANSTLDNAQKWTFIVFLVFFPFFGVSLATWLILRHSRKLAVAAKDDQPIWQLMSPQKQRQKMNLEIRQLADELAIKNEQVNQLRTAFIVAEDLALRQIEFEVKSHLVRNVAIRGAEFDSVHLDAEKFTFIEVTFIATEKLSQEKINAILKKVEHAQRAVVQLRPGSKVRLLLILVTQLSREAEANFRANLASKFTNTPVDVDIRLFDFEQLQKSFAVD